MYTKNVLAVSGALLSAVAAVPMNKRDIVWVTHTDVVMETVAATKTVWVQPGETVSAAASPSHYGHGHHSKHSSSTSAAEPTTTSTSAVETTSSSSTPVYTPSTSSSSSTSSSVYVAPTTSSTSSSVYVAPTTSSTSSSVYVAPTTSSTSSSVYVAPTTSTSVYVAPTTSSTPAPEPTTYAAPSSSTSSAAAATSSASSGSGSGSDYTGQATYYTPGLGSCGTTASESDAVVALSHVNMAAVSPANPNANPYCDKWINISYKGKSAKAKVVDTCPGCAENGLDLSPTVFQELASLDEGRLFDVDWSFA